MTSRERLETLYQKQAEFRKYRHSYENELRKDKENILNRIQELLKWKEENLGHKYYFGTIRLRPRFVELRKDCVVVFIWDPERHKRIFLNIPYEEISSDDWKETALVEYENKKRRREEEMRQRNSKALEEWENRERREYERLKAKYEGTA